MRILVLGGAGVQGSVVVKDLAKQDDVSEVIIGDIDLGKAQKLADELGMKHISARLVDVYDAQNLSGVMERANVVVNTTGPFYKIGDRVAKAAAEVKANYVDICDDPEPTFKLLDLDGAAKKAGVTFIIGMGGTPGATNIMAKRGADRLDKVDEIKVAWLGNAKGHAGDAVILHGFHMLEEPILQFLGGELQEVVPFSGLETVDFRPDDPNRKGVYNLIYIKHPEPVTLPRFIKGMKEVTVKANAYPEEYRLDTTWKQLVELGMTGKEPILIKGVEISPREFTIALMKGMMEAPVSHDGGVEEEYSIELKVNVIGEKEGKRAEYWLYMEDTLERVTGLSASVGAVMLGRGAIQAKGAFPPEGCVDPEMFIEEMKKRSIRRFKEGDLL